MSYTLVLVGGSGQRFGLGLGYLNLLGLAKMPSRVLVIDAEKENAVTERARDLLRYANPGVHFKHINPYRASASNPTIASCIDIAASDLFPLLISEEEAAVSVKNGFYASPKLAATIFRAMLQQQSSVFEGELEPGANQTVVVVGSVAGGTGAGIIREVARAFRDKAGSSEVFGIIFSRYFSIPPGNQTQVSGETFVTDDDLDQNARLGCDYLLRDLDSPFQVISFVGPPAGAPMPAPLAPAEGIPHVFPGMAAALSLVTDGVKSLRATLDAARLAQVQSPSKRVQVRLTTAFGASNGTAHLGDEDISFPVKSRDKEGFLSLADARDIAELTKNSLAEWRAFPFSDAAGKLSLFVERKLGARVSEALKQLSPSGHIRREDVEQLSEKLAGNSGAIDRAISGLQEFERWVGEMVRSESLRARSAKSRVVVAHDWRDALHGAPRIDLKTGLSDLSQLWCVELARVQWVPESTSSHRNEGGRWLFPYADAACDAPPGKLKELKTDIAVGRARSRSYPTPFGQGHAFAKALELGFVPERKLAEIMWLALGCGWLEIEVQDLESRPSEFDNLVGDIEPHSRFTGVISVRSGDELPSQLRPYFGKVIGAIHSSCGPVPGVRREAQVILSAIGDALNEHHRLNALKVLAVWASAIDRLASERNWQGEPSIWRRFLRDLLRDQHSAGTAGLSAHIRTRGPCVLRVASGIVEPLYFFTYEPNRSGLVHRVLDLLKRGEATMSADGQISHGRELIARVEVGVVKTKQGLIDTEATARAGFLDVDVLKVDMTGKPATVHDPLETIAKAGRWPESVQTYWQQRAAQHLLDASPTNPDLFWDRLPTFDRMEAVRITTTTPPAALADRVVLLRDMASEAPDVPGIAFHPGRKHWIVWLRDILNPDGHITAIAGSSSSVRVTRNNNSWILSFPTDKVTILSPKDIFVSDVHAFSGIAGGDSREKVRHVPAIPVRREYLDLVMCRDDQPLARESQDGGVDFQVVLFGGIAVGWHLPSARIHLEERVHAEIWPNLPKARWNRFWLALESDSASAVSSFEYIVLGSSPDGYYQPLLSLDRDGKRPTRYVSFTGKPRALWIGAAGAGGAFTVFAGGKEDREGHGEATVSVDFGTFRSAVLVSVPASERSESMGSFAACRLEVIPNPNEATSRRKNKSLFPPTSGGPGSAGKTGTSAMLFPSVVVHAKQDEPGGGGSPTADTVPFTSFGIPCGPLEGLDEFPGSHEEDQAGLKWSESSQASHARLAYLKAILLLGAVEAFQRGATSIKIRYSFPLALGRQEQLEDSFRKAAEWVHSDVIGARPGERGASLELRQSESGAAMRASEAHAAWCMTLDLGGGTLDVGLFQRTNGASRPIAWDSVKLGGNLITSAYARAHGKPERLLRWEITEGKLVPDRPLQEGVQKLLRLCMEYGARVAAGTLAQQTEQPRGVEMTVLLLGSGWRWYSAISDTKNFDAVAFEQVHAPYLLARIHALAPGVVKSVVINGDLLARGTEKLAVARGLSLIDSSNGASFDRVRAPNGLDEGAIVSWKTIIDRQAKPGEAQALIASPPFPMELESATPFTQSLEQTADRQRVLTRLAESVAVDGTRNRTALGVAFDLFAPGWFR